MPWSMAVFTFVNSWWIVLFLVMPFFIRPSEKPQPQEYAAAPQPLRWKKMLLVNTLASLLVTAALAWLVHSGLVPLRDWY